MRQKLLSIPRFFISFRFSVLLSLLLVGGVLVLFGVVPLDVSVRHAEIPKTVTTAKLTPVNNDPTNKLPVFGTILGTTSSAPTAQRSAALQEIKAVGITEIRVNFNWSTMEPVKGKYDWTGTDALLQSINDAGLKTIIQIDHTPSWNRPSICKTDPNCAPTATDQYGTFAAAAATRYKKYNIVAYEIWNEQNSVNFWKPFPNPNQYAHLLDSANKAIKRADPTAVVLLGGLSGDSVDRWGSTFVDPRTYLAQVYAAGAKDDFDGVAYHPYIKGFGLPSSVSEFNGWAKLATGDNNIRSIMEANGDTAKGVWITEFGITTGGKGAAVTDPTAAAPNGADHASYAAEAQITQAVLDEARQYDWIRDFIWYDYKDDRDAATKPDSGYGLWDYNGQPKPIVQTIKNAISTPK